jgi:hypothetical protein
MLMVRHAMVLPLKNDRHAAHSGNLTGNPCRLPASVQLELRNASQKFLYHDLGFDSKNMCGNDEHPFQSAGVCSGRDRR